MAIRSSRPPAQTHAASCARLSKSERHLPLRNRTTPLQKSNHHDDQGHDEKKMNKTPDGGEWRDKRTQDPKNEQYNENGFEHDTPP